MYAPGLKVPFEFKINYDKDEVKLKKRPYFNLLNSQGSDFNLHHTATNSNVQSSTSIRHIPIMEESRSTASLASRLTRMLPNKDMSDLKDDYFNKTVDV